MIPTRTSNIVWDLSVRVCVCARIVAMCNLCVLSVVDLSVCRLLFLEGGVGGGL